MRVRMLEFLWIMCPWMPLFHSSLSWSLLYFLWSFRSDFDWDWRVLDISGMPDFGNVLISLTLMINAGLVKFWIRLKSLKSLNFMRLDTVFLGALVNFRCCCYCCSTVSWEDFLGLNMRENWGKKYISTLIWVCVWLSVWGCGYAKVLVPNFWAI